MAREKKAVDPKSWVSAEVRTDPFIFKWQVVVSGPDEDRQTPWCEWLDSKDGEQRLFPRVTPGVGRISYTPPNGLFRAFAATDPSPESIADFAGQFGDIFYRQDIKSDRQDKPADVRLSGGEVVRGTSLARWLSEIARMREFVELWDQIQDKRRHAELKQVIVRGDDYLAYRRDKTFHMLAIPSVSKNFPAKDNVRAARAALALEINKTLKNADTLVLPQLAWTPNYQQRIIFRPSNLLAEMWIRFAQVVAGDFALKKCAASGCNEYFQVGLGARRRHKDTCSDKCRQRKSRGA